MRVAHRSLEGKRSRGQLASHLPPFTLSLCGRGGGGSEHRQRGMGKEGKISAKQAKNLSFLVGSGLEKGLKAPGVTSTSGGGRKAKGKGVDAEERQEAVGDDSSFDR